MGQSWQAWILRGLVPAGLEQFTAWVNLEVEIGVNPDSHPWADAPDGCRAAR